MRRVPSTLPVHALILKVPNDENDWKELGEGCFVPSVAQGVI